MPAFTLPNTWQVRLTWDLNATPQAQNVLHYRRVLGGTVDQALADNVKDAVVAHFNASTLKAQIGSTWRLGTVDVRDISQANLPLFSSSAQVLGTNVSQPLPPPVACVVTLRTAKAGRSFRGRTYIAGLTESANTGNGEIGTAARDGCADFMTRMLTLEDASAPAFTLFLAVGSRTLNVTNDVIGATVRDGLWDNQRRRKDPVLQA